DVAGVKKRLDELDGLMAAETFWDNRERAQKLIDEAASHRKRIEPLFEAEKKLEDLQVMVELCESEPEDSRLRHLKELESDVARFATNLEALELEVLLRGPHDHRNCIMSINAGAGGTEACDWANMLLRMYQRWCEARGWESDVTDALAGET